MILYWCHYVIGLAVSKLKCEYKDVHAQGRGLSRGRGQTKKLATALTRQKTNLTVFEDSASSDNSDDSGPSSVKRKTAPQKTRQKRLRKPASN